MKEIIKINEKDNVAVALRDLIKNQIVEIDDVKINLKDDVKRGHKVAINNISINENVIKYGYPIGYATKGITAGEWVHTHNIKTNLDGIKDYTFNQELIECETSDRKIKFKAYDRGNGNVGIRNELWVVPTVGCVNGIGERIIERFKEEVKPEEIDAIEVFKHNYGCSQLGDDHINTRTVLGNLVKHPNAVVY